MSEAQLKHDLAQGITAIHRSKHNFQSQSEIYVSQTNTLGSFEKLQFALNPPIGVPNAVKGGMSNIKLNGAQMKLVGNVWLNFTCTYTAPAVVDSKSLFSMDPYSFLTAAYSHIKYIEYQLPGETQVFRWTGQQALHTILKTMDRHYIKTKLQQFYDQVALCPVELINEIEFSVKNNATAANNKGAGLVYSPQTLASLTNNTLNTYKRQYRMLLPLFQCGLTRKLHKKYKVWPQYMIAGESEVRVFWADDVDLPWGALLKGGSKPHKDIVLASTNNWNGGRTQIGYNADGTNNAITGTSDSQVEIFYPCTFDGDYDVPATVGGITYTIDKCFVEYVNYEMPSVADYSTVTYKYPIMYQNMFTVTHDNIKSNNLEAGENTIGKITVWNPIKLDRLLAGETTQIDLVPQYLLNNVPSTYRTMPLGGIKQMLVQVANLDMYKPIGEAVDFIDFNMTDEPATIEQTGLLVDAQHLHRHLTFRIRRSDTVVENDVFRKCQLNADHNYAKVRVSVKDLEEVGQGYWEGVDFKQLPVHIQYSTYLRSQHDLHVYQYLRKYLIFSNGQVQMTE